MGCRSRSLVKSQGQTVTSSPTRTSSRGSSPTRPTRAIEVIHDCGKLNDTPTFSRRSSRSCRRGCRCRCWRRGMLALPAAERVQYNLRQLVHNSLLGHTPYYITDLVVPRTRRRRIVYYQPQSQGRSQNFYCGGGALATKVPRPRAEVWLRPWTELSPLLRGQTSDCCV